MAVGDAREDTSVSETVTLDSLDRWRRVCWEKVVMSGQTGVSCHALSAASGLPGGDGLLLSACPPRDERGDSPSDSSKISCDGQTPLSTGEK